MKKPNALNFEKPISAETRIYAVLGDPICQSLSPKIHNFWFAKAGLDSRYIALHLTGEKPADRIAALFHLGISGLNITAPYKEAAFESAIEQNPISQNLGVANLLCRSSQGWEARNSDGEGFLWALESQLLGLESTRSPKNFTLVGAGGAATAILDILARKYDQASINLVNRSLHKAEKLVSRLGLEKNVTITELTSFSPKGEDEIVISTLAGEKQSVLIDRFTPKHKPALILDIAYGKDLRLNHYARLHQIPYNDGLAMLVGQAAISFETWTGISPDREAALQKIREENN